MSSPTRPIGGSQYSVALRTQTFSNNSGLISSTNIVATTSDLLWSLAVEATDFPDFSSLATVFDQYRLDKLQIQLMPYGNIRDPSTASATSQFPPLLYTIIDRDDSTAPASISAVLQYDNCQIVPATTGQEFQFVPSVTRALYSSGAFSGYEAVPSNECWVDIANLAVPFYGLKGAVTALPATSTNFFVWKVTACAIFSFKNKR